MRAAATLALVLALAGAAQAQQAAQTPLEQALFQRLATEVEAGIRANVKIIELQQQISTMQEAIRRLTPKPAEDNPPGK